jgi:hypothetical protein
MEINLAGLFGAIGALAFFGCIAFSVWVDYRKKKDRGERLHSERIKALELGYPPPDADIERAKAYASAAWAAGLIGLLVPIAVLGLTVGGTLFAVAHREPGENLATPLIVAWSIAGVLVLIAILRSLSVIHHLPRPLSDAQPKAAAPANRANASSTEFQQKHLEL